MVYKGEVFRQVFGSIVRDRSGYGVWCIKNPPLLYFGLWIMNCYMWFFEFSLCLSCCVVFKKMEEGFERWLELSNAKWRSAECVRNSIRAPCRCRGKGMWLQVTGKSKTLIGEYRRFCWNYYSGRKLGVEDSSLTYSGVFPRVDWWVVVRCKHLMTFRRIIEPSSSGQISARTLTLFISVYVFQYSRVLESWEKKSVRTWSKAKSTFFWFTIQSFISGDHTFNAHWMTAVESIYMLPGVQQSGEAMLSTDWAFRKNSDSKGAA